jgi:hypothetical protein
MQNKIPPDLPFSKGGERHPPFDKGGYRGIRMIFQRAKVFPFCNDLLIKGTL